MGLLPVFADAAIYFSKTTGNANSTSTWGSNSDGTGTSPVSFVLGDVFNVRNGSSLTTNAAWTINSSGVAGGGRLTIQLGGILTASHQISFVGTGTRFRIEGNGTYIHSNASDLTAGVLSAVTKQFVLGSFFEINTSGTHTSLGAAIFGNLTISSSATVEFTEDTNTPGIRNILTIAAGSTLFFSDDTDANQIINSSSFSTAGTGLLRLMSSNPVCVPEGRTWSFQVNYENTSSQQVIDGTYSNLNTSGGPRTVEASANIILTNSFTPGAGAFTIGTGATFEYSANGSGSIPALPYQNLTTSGTGTKTMAADFTVLATLSVTNPTGFLFLNGHILTLNNGTNLSNGRLIGSPSSSIVIGGNTNSTSSLNFNTSGTDNQLNSLTMNRTGGGGASLASNIDIINRLVLTNGILITNNNTLALRSTSIANSARVDAVGAGASITYGSVGGIRSERFIPSSPGHRSYRDLSPGGVYTDRSFIFENWQESAGSTTGLGTHITGIVGAPGNDATTGLDRTLSGNIAMFTYNGSTYPSVTNTKSTRLDPYRGYRILIRGDRNVDLTQSPTPTNMNTATTLRATGKLIYGDVNFSTSGVSNGVYNSSYALNSASSTGFSLIGNPYACPVSWGKILDNGAGNTENILGTYWYFDPQQGVNGVYTTWINLGGETGTNSGVGNTNNFIQPGQAIFVRNTSTSPKVQINEGDKAILSTATSVFSTPAPKQPTNKLGILLHRSIAGRGEITLDGSVLLFGINNLNEISANEDAGKITNGGENMAFVNKSSGTAQVLSIESRKPITDKDTIPIQLWRMVNNEIYTLKLLPKQFNAIGKFSFVRDKFLNKETFIRSDLDTIAIPFTTLSTDSTSFYTRFSIIAKSPFPTLQKNESVLLAGALDGNKINLKWEAKNEADHLLYDIEKSTNGVEYNFLARSFPNGTSSYIYTDTAVSSGNNYYRIRTYNQAAGFWNSNIVSLEKDNLIDFISIYPNPVSGNTVNIRMNKLSPGNYLVNIVDQNGRVHFSSTLVHTAQSLTAPLNFNRILANGIYHLQLMHTESKKKYSSKMVVANK